MTHHLRGPKDGFHVGYHRFVTHADYITMTEALGFGNDRDEPAATPAELLDPLAEALNAANDHFECPRWCDDCAQWEALMSCEPCHGSGCGPGTALGAYDPCEHCAGDGREHVEYRPDGSSQPTPPEVFAAVLAEHRITWRTFTLAVCTCGKWASPDHAKGAVKAPVRREHDAHVAQVLAAIAAARAKLHETEPSEET